MGTSLSGLTPATTFDGLLKVGDNDPLTADLKAISTGDGTDTVLSLSNSALQVNGDLNIGSVHQAYQDLNDLIIKGNSGSTYLKYYTNSGNNLTNQFGVGNFLKYNTVIGDSTLPNTSAPMLRIKGSGANNETTSLLVQNSVGADLLRVRDDSVVSAATFYSTVSRLSYINTITNSYTVMQSHLADGNASFYQSVAVGQTTTPTARLHVKGSGNDDTTTSLLVQNSDGADLMEVTDNGILKISTAPSFNTLNIYSDGINDLKRIGTGTGLSIGTSVFYAAANTQVHIKGQGANSATTALLVQNSAGTGLLKVGDGGNVGIGETTPTARLHIKGEAPSGDPLNNPTALLVENSAGTELLKVTDDSVINVRQTLFVNHPSVSSRSLKLGWGSIYATDNASELSIGAVVSEAATAPRIVLSGKTRASGADAIQVQTLNGMYIATTALTEDPSAQLHIKGSAPVEDPPGTFTNPTALLVQNSAGADLLKVENAGTIGMTGFTIESNIIKPRVNGFIGISRNDNRTFSIGDSNASRTYLNIQSSSTSNFADVSVNTDHLVVKKEGNVAVGTSTLDASAKLQVDSTTQGFLPPRMTFDQRNAITAPAVGLIVYQTDGDEGVYVNTSTGWKQMQLIG